MLKFRRYWPWKTLSSHPWSNSQKFHVLFTLLSTGSAISDVEAQEHYDRFFEVCIFFFDFFTKAVLEEKLKGAHPCTVAHQGAQCRVSILKLRYSGLPGEKVWCQGKPGSTAIAKPCYSLKSLNKTILWWIHWLSYFFLQDVFLELEEKVSWIIKFCFTHLCRASKFLSIN